MKSLILGLCLIAASFVTGQASATTGGPCVMDTNGFMWCWPGAKPTNAVYANEPVQRNGGDCIVVNGWLWCLHRPPQPRPQLTGSNCIVDAAGYEWCLDICFDNQGNWWFC